MNFNPSKHFEEIEDLKGLWPFLKKYKLTIYFVLLLVLISSVIAIIIPYIYKLLVDLLTDMATHKITLQQASESIVLIAGGYIILSILKSFINMQYEYLGEKIVFYIEKDINSYSFERVLSFDYNYREKHSTGEIIQKINKATTRLENIAWDMLFDFLPSIITGVIAIFVLFSFEPRLALISLIFVPIYFWIAIRYAKMAHAQEKIITPLYEMASNQEYQALSLFELVKSYAKTAFEYKNFLKIYNEIVRRLIIQGKLWRNRGIIVDILEIINTSLIILFGGYLVIKGEITIGTVVMFLSYVHMIYDPLHILGKIYNNIKKSVVAIHRLLDMLFKTKIEINDAPDAINLKKVAGEIELKQVNFCYEKNKKKYVLKDINLKIKPSECVAIVGPSGGGKSTLAKLLLRFYDVSKGAILIDDKDIRKVTQKSLRENIAYVSQDPGIFNNTTAANIKYGKLNASDSEIIKAAKNANIHDFITKLPKGYNSVVGERGIKLSGGEKQRIALARAFLKNAPILVLDEPTSALDSESEEKVQGALLNLIKNRTTIIIAHRLSTVMRADKIVVINKGRVVEVGSHKDLLKKKTGLYAKLFNIQSGAMLLE